MRHILGLATGVFLSVLAANLLYLYYAGAWYDPIVWIEKTEVVLLYIIFVMGIVQSVVSIKTMSLHNG